MGTQISDADDRFEASLGLLKALGDGTRLRIVWALARRERPVSELAELAGANVAATSQHLARLREAGVVTGRRDGTRIFYQLASDQVRVLLDEVTVTVAALDLATSPDAVEPDAAASREPLRHRATAAAPRLAAG